MSSIEKQVSSPAESEGADYRFVHGLVPLTTQHRKAKGLAYCISATESLRGKTGFRFDQLCQSKTGYPDLKAALGLLPTKRSEFLAMPDCPQMPLHIKLS